ncbi:MAG: VWA domain-containing protein [Candidatus Heimdallarchaeota archaeon]|nr:MAG: VWA domain-containing protein [Candidatus Heimdallarchaeota archaeon]
MQLTHKRIAFPFSAIVAMDKLKLATIVNAINPKIGGVLIQGAKGSGKTTVARGLTDILPELEVVKGCSFNCNPHDLSNMCETCGEKYRKGEQFEIEEREMAVVDLPLGATEDRVVGSLDVEKAIKHGIGALEPGILAEANQNILYVDEVNLLPDHVADDLLDAAATGWNVVEREGISVRHPSRFVFIGTMNPEEGQLRPQLLDRFPLSVSVERIMTVEDRMEVVKRTIEFEANPERFIEIYKESQIELRNRIIAARKLLSKVELPEKLLEVICLTCLDLQVDGMRPDIVISKTAQTLAAFENRSVVTPDDILIASELTLKHRTREGGFQDPATPEEIAKLFVAKVKQVKYVEQIESSDTDQKKKREKPKGRVMIWAPQETTEKEEDLAHRKSSKTRARIFQFFSRIGPSFALGKRLRKSPEDSPVMNGAIKQAENIKGEISEGVERGKFKGIPSVTYAVKSSDMRKGNSLISRIKDSILSPFKPPDFKKTRFKGVSSTAGKRAESITTLHRGRPWGWKFPKGKPSDIHLPATIRAAARHQNHRVPSLGTSISISLEDVREKLRVYKAPMTLIFVIDLSGSMMFNIEASKEALLRLHRDAYRYRDKVGIVALKDTRAVVVQHPITNLGVVANKLFGLKISGFTPLAAGMLKALDVLKETRRRDRATIPVIVIITDGNTNVPLYRSLETGELRDFKELGIALREFEDLAVKDVVSVSKAIEREGIHTVIVNTNPHYIGRETYGFAVTKIITSITKGSHHQISRLSDGEELVEDIFEGISEDQRKISAGVPLSQLNVWD